MRVSYAAVAADLIRYVRALQRVPIQPGMLVGVETLNRYLHLQLLLACEIIGATTVSLAPPDLASDSALVRDCNVLLTTDSVAPSPKTVVMTADWLAEVVASAVSAADLALLDRRIPEHQVVRIARSSGTTANPKLIEITLAKQQLIVTRNAERIAGDLELPQRFLCLYHLTVRSVWHRVIGCLLQGGSIWFAMESEAPDLIAAGAVNTVLFLMGDAERLVRLARPPPAGHQMLVWGAGSAAGPPLRDLIRQRLNAEFFNHYSSNEAGRVTLVDDSGVGELCPGVEVRIVGDDGKERPFGETGLILVKTETMVDGYRNDPVLTASRFVDGWFDMRDVGYMPAPDRLVVLGRADDVLNIGGVKLSPGPIEEQIKTIDGITDAALLSIDEENQTSTLLVAIETATGDLPPGFAARIDPIMAPYMMTFKLLITRQFPRTETRKLRRKDLIAMAQTR